MCLASDRKTREFYDLDLALFRFDGLLLRSRTLVWDVVYISHKLQISRGLSLDIDEVEPNSWSAPGQFGMHGEKCPTVCFKCSSPYIWVHPVPLKLLNLPQIIRFIIFEKQGTWTIRSAHVGHPAHKSIYYTQKKKITLMLGVISPPPPTTLVSQLARRRLAVHWSTVAECCTCRRTQKVVCTSAQ